MEKKYKGYLIAISIALLYNLIKGGLDLDILSSIATIIGTLIIPLVIAGVVSSFSKSNINFGTLFAYVTAIFCVIALIGHFAGKI